MDFAVKVTGLDEKVPVETYRWVLAVEGDRVLITHDDNSLHWVEMADCTLVRAVRPDMPTPVVVVQPQGQQPALAAPNRASRRRIERVNGGF